MKCKTAFKNHEEGLEPFYIMVYNGIFYTILRNVIIEFVKLNFKYHDQRLQQCFIAVVAYTGKVTSHSNGLILNSTFH